MGYSNEPPGCCTCSSWAFQSAYTAPLLHLRGFGSHSGARHFEMQNTSKKMPNTYLGFMFVHSSLLYLSRIHYRHLAGPLWVTQPHWRTVPESADSGIVAVFWTWQGFVSTMASLR